LTPGFKAEYTAAVNVAVNQGLSWDFSAVNSAGISAGKNAKVSVAYSGAVNRTFNSTVSADLSSVTSRAASSGLTCAFSRSLSAAASRASNVQANVWFRTASNGAIPMQVL